MATVALSSRRFACDRCRGQKLRCLRERQDPDRCDRCLKADTDCLTTPSTISSNSTDLSTTTPQKRKHPGPPRVPTTAYTDLRAPSGPLRGGLAHSEPADSLEWPRIWDGSLNNVEFGTGLEDIVMPSLDYQRPNTCATIGSHVFAPSQPISPFVVTSEDAQDTPSRQDIGKSGSSISDALGFSMDGVLNSGESQTSSSSSDPSDSYIRRLTNTNLSLLSQLSRIDQSPPKVTLDILVSKSDESDPSSSSPVENMLSTTREFIEVLEALSRKPTSSTTPSSSSLASAGDITESSTSLDGNGRVDITTLLIILSCYVQVLRLYSVLFAHIYQFLLEIAESDDPTLCPLPNMGFGTFSLESGNLQATLFIQIATSLFEKLECLLGLPPELRITMRAVDRGGLCVHDDFQEVVKIVLSKDEIGRPENGKGGVVSLRKNMKRSMQLLRESIAP
ncbi:hypothetical protein ONZ43_g648 [Nemania bipapillata]|uniref:Uncharacterized protein n=1 Tax=Nemania bipapillata TaxID=110536 RepID=A0ACC2J7F6_9PEZI|nr:hypothetical protein ONZ43_g648 [Nemania bipapillata]